MSDMATSANLLTVSQIAKQLGVERHRVRYVLKQRRIPAVVVTSRLKLYRLTALRRVRKELKIPLPEATSSSSGGSVVGHRA